MKRSRFSEEQIIGVLKEAEATTVKGACAKYNLSEASYYNRKRKYGGMEVDEARRLRADLLVECESTWRRDGELEGVRRRSHF